MPDSHVNLFGVELELYFSYLKTELRAAQPRRDPRDARRLAPCCGGRLVCRAVAPFRVVKMRRRSLTPRFASKTIRSLAHFHSAGDEGMTLVGIWRAFAPALASRGASGVPAESIFGGVKMRPRKLDEKLSRHGLGARRVALLAPWGPRRKEFRWGKTCDVQ